MSMTFDPFDTTTTTTPPVRRYTDPLILRGKADDRDRVGFTTARDNANANGHRAIRTMQRNRREV